MRSQCLLHLCERYALQFVKKKFCDNMSESVENVWILTKVKNPLLLVNTTMILAVTMTILIGFWWSRNIKEFYIDRARTIQLASKLPGPPALPLIGNALTLACSSEEILNRFVELSNKYGTPMRFWLGPKLLVALSEPRDYEIILSCREASYKHELYQLVKPLIGQGLVTGSGPMQRGHRKVIMPMLNSKALIEYFEYFITHCRTCSDLVDKQVETGPFDIYSYMSNCSFDMIFDTILGIPAGAQKEKPTELVHCVEVAYNNFHERATKVWLQSDWLYYRLNVGKKQKQCEVFLRRFIANVIARKKEQYFAEQNNDVPRKERFIFLEQLIEHVITNNFMSDSEMADETLTIFFAAQDTISLATSFSLLMLAMHPEIQDRMREEIRRVIGYNAMKFDHLADLNYTEMVIKETLRLFPLGPIILRRLTGDIRLDTCTLPKGCAVAITPFVTHRNGKFWTNPEKFIPERFSAENSIDRHPCAYIPFSRGLRGCIGQKYAMMAMKTMIVHIVKKFQLTTALKLETLRIKMDISVRSSDGYVVSVARI